MLELLGFVTCIVIFMPNKYLNNNQIRIHIQIEQQSYCLFVIQLHWIQFFRNVMSKKKQKKWYTRFETSLQIQHLKIFFGFFWVFFCQFYMSTTFVHSRYSIKKDGFDFILQKKIIKASTGGVFKLACLQHYLLMHSSLYDV